MLSCVHDVPTLGSRFELTMAQRKKIGPGFSVGFKIAKNDDPLVERLNRVTGATGLSPGELARMAVEKNLEDVAREYVAELAKRSEELLGNPEQAKIPSRRKEK